MRDLIDQARAEVENAGALIDEILFLSELESGREIVSLGHTSALPVLEGVVRELEDAAARAGVELVVEGDPDVDLPLRPRMLRMVVENLAENAIRYAGHGARFTLSIRRSGEFAILTAADDGAGVDEETLPRLFERFYRADAARTSRGTGLGLAIVKHVVAAAGGEVESDGGLGRGLRIRCIFPSVETTRGARRGALASTVDVTPAYVWIVFSVFSDATSTGFESGANGSFAAYCAF